MNEYDTIQQKSLTWTRKLSQHTQPETKTNKASAPLTKSVSHCYWATENCPCNAVKQSETINQL